MLTNDFRIAKVQRTLRWFEQDIPLLNMRVKELSQERQDSARKFAAALIDQTRAELERLAARAAARARHAQFPAAKCPLRARGLSCGSGLPARERKQQVRFGVAPGRPSTPPSRVLWLRSE
jgi:hypothetical protein